MSASASLSGQTLGSYELGEVIGTGGCGDVYRAHHTAIGRVAAVKVLHGSLGRDPTLTQRFFTEAKAAGQIRHSGMVEIYDFGRDHDGFAYLVMEYLEGETLRDRLVREGTLAETVATDVLRQLASVLAAAHAQGIIHRDLKPENVFLVADDLVAGGTRVKLLDFGIAKLVGEKQMSLTRTGNVVGTPAYMAPEQCRGTGKYDGRTDLYSLGCIFFEMLTGRPPFMAEFPGDMFIAHVSTPPPNVAQLRLDLSDEGCVLVNKLLAKPQFDRFDDANALLAAIDGDEVGEATKIDIDSQRLAGFVDIEEEQPRIGKALPTLQHATGQKESFRGARARPFGIAALTLAVIAAVAFFVVRGGETDEKKAASQPSTVGVPARSNEPAMLEPPTNGQTEAATAGSDAPTTTDNPEPTTDNPEPTTDNPEPTTDNPEPTTDNPEPTTDNPEPTTDNPEPTTDNPEPTTDNRKPKTKNRKPRTKAKRRPPKSRQPTAPVKKKIDRNVTVNPFAR